MIDPITISRFNHEKDNDPKLEQLTWQQLELLVNQPRRGKCTVATCPRPPVKCPDKYGAAWSPASYPIGAARSNANVIAVSLLVIDVDHVSDAVLTELDQRLKTYRYIGHASHSDRDGDRCIRLVLELSHPVAGPDWPRFWSAAITSLGLPADLTTCDASRIYFLPSRPIDAGYLFGTNEGAALDVDSILALAPAAVEKVHVEHCDYPAASPKTKQAAMERLMRHGPAVEGNRGNAHTRTAWGILVNNFALTDAEARPLMVAYNTTCAPPWDEAELFSGPARSDGQTWNGTRGDLRKQAELVGAGESVYQVAAGVQPATSEAPASPPVATPIVAMWVGDVAGQPQIPTLFYPTGNTQLDQLLGGGLATGIVSGVVGPPSVGKSAYVGSMCLTLQQTLPVLHVSTELTRRELMIRYAALQRGFPWREALKGHHDAVLVEACRGLRIKMIGMDQLDTDHPLEHIAREAVDIRQEFGVAPVVVIDYVQLLARGTEDGTRARVGELTKKIRILSQVMNCVVIAVFSTGRGFYGSGKLEKLRALNDPTAYLGAAKESGDIEYDCATILFLDVDQHAEGPSKPASVAVARCRFGDIGFAGYRARLDLGLWVPDPSARLAMMTPRSATPDAREKVHDELDKRIIEHVRQLQTRGLNAAGISQLLSKTDLAVDLGGRKEANLIAITRLVHSERLADDVEHIREGHSRKVIRLGKVTL